MDRSFVSRAVILARSTSSSDGNGLGSQQRPEESDQYTVACFCDSSGIPHDPFEFANTSLYGDGFIPMMFFGVSWDDLLKQRWKQELILRLVRETMWDLKNFVPRRAHANTK